MIKVSPLVVSSIALATLAFCQPALAHPGGGLGGGMGGSMGMGGGFGASRGMSMSGSGFETRSHASVSTHSSTTTLNNAHVDSALTTALTRKGIALPSGGLQSACSGFHNLGQCVAALHVAQNLNLPGGFTALKGLMTGSSPESLGGAIQKLSPRTDAKAAERTAKHQANHDLEQADQDGIAD
jgi:hypothetical protein